MKKALSAPLIIIIHFFIYVLIFASMTALEFKQKSAIAEMATMITRENILITDFRSVAKDLEKFRQEHFSKITVADKNDDIISSIGEKGISLRIIKRIWIDNSHKILKGTINFYVPILPLVYFSFQIFCIILIFTLPAVYFFNLHMSREQAKVLENEKIKTLAELTQQISHDIKSPLTTLKFLLDSTTLDKEDDKNLLKRSLNRLIEIANFHLDTKDESLNKIVNHNLADLVKDIIDEKKIEYPEFNFKIEFDNTFISCNEFDLKRIVSNLINNAVEASSKSANNTILITVNSDEHCSYLDIKDNGTGISQKLLEKLGKERITTKNKGNGIGLFSAFEKLKEWNGEIKISSNNLGTTISLIFPKLITKYILIDNDELTRLTWEAKARKKKIDLTTMSSSNHFESIKHNFEKNCFIYIDSDLGDQQKGEDYAEALFNEGFQNIFITTGFAKDRFIKYTFLKGVISKTVPY